MKYQRGHQNKTRENVIEQNFLDVHKMLHTLQ